MTFVAQPNILMVAAEAVPFAKTGGLADVVGSLPAALRLQGCEARVALPLYAAIDRAGLRQVARVTFPFDGAPRSATLLETTSAAKTVSGVTYFVDAPEYFDRTDLYGYPDDALRFGFFCRALLEALHELPWRPHLIHCHDWHAGLLPAYLATDPQFARLRDMRILFTIHNLAYQGVSDAGDVARLGLDPALFNWRQLEFYGKLNPMKGGLAFADALTTVSPNYAREIQSPEHGAGLEGLLFQRRAALHGILNGIDYNEWNPRRDPHIAANFGPADVAGKEKCKHDLLVRMGLPLPGRKPRPLIGIVSRLSEQKGFDLVHDALEELVALGCYLVVLGSGSEAYHAFLERERRLHPKSVACSLGQFNNELAHRIYAGSDMFLMPSRFEPCGLGQMISLAYGTVSLPPA